MSTKVPPADMAARAQYGATTKVAINTTAAAKNSSALGEGMYRLIADVACHVRHVGADTTAATIGDAYLPAGVALSVYVSNAATTAYVSAIAATTAGSIYLTKLEP